MALKYKHIIWDWNGTLLNDIDLCIDIMNKLLEKNNLAPVSIDRYKEIFTIPVSTYYESLGFDITNGNFEKIGKEFMDVYEIRKCECNLYPEVLSILKKLKELGIEQSVLSAYSHETLVEILQTYGISNYFIYVMGASDIYATGKVEQGRELIKSIDVERDKVVMVGDSLHDYEVAETIGIDCFLISNGHQSKKVIEKSGAKILDSLSELLYVIIS